MKIAIVHDYIKEYGGAERVLEVLHEIWPEAPIYTSLYLPEFLGPHKERFKGWDIRTSWLQKIPFKEHLMSPFRVIGPSVFEAIDFTGFDAVLVSSTSAYIANLLVLQPETVHICYCHTPPRYLYGYKTARDYQSNLIVKGVSAVLAHFMRQVDFLAAQRVDYYIANSENIRSRIKKFYRREAGVIYPPVGMVDKVSKFQSFKVSKNKIKGYYLTGGRLAQSKGIDLVIQTFNKLNLPLKIFGRGFAGFEAELKKIAGGNVEFLGEVEEDELIDLYRGARAFVFAAEEEDFGIVPVEAMSCGVPVVALNQGGVRETVVNNVTGILFDEATTEGLEKAIKSLNFALDKQMIKPENCVGQAEKFSKKRFIKEMKSYVESKAREYAGTT